MKYCSQCSAENKDGATACAECGNAELLSVTEMKRRGIPLAGELDTRRFERAATVDDPLTAEEVTDFLRSRNIPVFSRQRMAGTVDRLTDGTLPYWEILVPEERLEEAVPLIEQAQANLESTEEEAARAAEEEAAETEASGAKPA